MEVEAADDESKKHEHSFKAGMHIENATVILEEQQKRLHHVEEAAETTVHHTKKIAELSDHKVAEAASIPQLERAQLAEESALLAEKKALTEQLDVEKSLT